MLKKTFILLIIVIVFTGCSKSTENLESENSKVNSLIDDVELSMLELEISNLELEVAELKDTIIELEASNNAEADAITLEELSEDISDTNENVLYFLGSKRYTRLEMQPQNEALEDESFLLFIEEFREAISKRDLEFAIEHMDHTSLEPYMDSVPNFDEFLMEYGLTGDDVEGAVYWDIMGELLELGFEDIGTEDNKAYYAPYFGDYKFIVESYDEFSESFGICTGENVNIRNKPNIDSVIIDQVDYLILEYGKDQDYDSSWTQVILPDGRTGYIHSDYIRSDFDYRCIFEFKDGKWLMTMLMAGC